MLTRLAAGSQDPDPAGRYCLVHAPPAGQRGVEPAGERDRRGVGNGVLHGGHCRYPLRASAAAVPENRSPWLVVAHARFGPLLHAHIE